MVKGLRKRKRKKERINKKGRKAKAEDLDERFRWSFSYLKFVISYGQIIGILQELSDVCHDRLLIRVTDINV